MSDAFTVAAQARRFVLLADRPALLYPDRDQRAERVLADDTRPDIDVLLIGGASEADRVCAAAVKTLREKTNAGVLGLLSVLPADYLLGIYYALPVERRGQCESDPVWAYHLRRVPEGVEEAQATLEGLAEEDAPELLLEPDEAMAYRLFSAGLLREQLADGD